MLVSGIAKGIVDKMVTLTSEISQGRNVGCFGFMNEDHVIDRITPLTEGGISGLPLRKMLSDITNMEGKSHIEGIQRLPESTVLIMTRPGKTGLLTDVSGIDFFNIPMIAIGVKNNSLAGVCVVYPKPEFFDLATESEKVDLKTLAAKSVEEEKEILRRGADLSLKYLDISEEIQVIDTDYEEGFKSSAQENDWSLPKLEVESISLDFAEKLVGKSMEVGQGREVSAIGVIDEKGNIAQIGELIVGGIGYVPARLMASSAVDIKGKALRVMYVEDIPPNGVIVHTHPGGTGVMHIGDANAGPTSWGRPIVAIGHDNEGKIRGATVIEVTNRVFELADEDEELGIKFFDAETPEEEADIRNRKFGVAQEYTNLCKPIEIR